MFATLQSTLEVFHFDLTKYNLPPLFFLCTPPVPCDNVFTPYNNFQCFSCGVLVTVEYP